jgi:hypothetical protein
MGELFVTVVDAASVWVFVLNSPSEDGPGIMCIMHIMSPHLQKRKLHQGITENTLAEAS